MTLGGVEQPPIGLATSGSRSLRKRGAKLSAFRKPEILRMKLFAPPSPYGGPSGVSAFDRSQVAVICV